MNNAARHLTAVGKKQDTVKLHIGCGGNRLPGYVNCDYIPGAVGAEMFFDATKPWPFADNSVSEVYSSHFLEHIDNPKAFFKEAWRCMHDNALMVCRLPHGGHQTAWTDLTHVRPWFPPTFCFLQPNYIQDTRNPQHTWTHFFGVHYVECRVNPKLHKFMRWPIENFFLNHIDFFADAVQEMVARLYCIKSSYTMHYFLSQSRGNTVGVTYVKDLHENRKTPA